MEKITIKYDPRHEPFGSTSFVRWKNPDVIDALRQIFNVREGEVITGIELDEHGITARFQTK